MSQTDPTLHVRASRRLKQAEGKIATLSIIHGALQKENDELREVLSELGSTCSHSVSKMQPIRACNAADT